MIGHRSRFQENDNLPLRRGLVVKKKPPFSNARALITRKICAVGMRNEILGKDLKLSTKSRATVFENHVTLNPNSFRENCKILKAHSILDHTSCEFFTKLNMKYNRRTAYLFPQTIKLSYRALQFWQLCSGWSSSECILETS